jgi:hypothetical protein
MRNRREEPHVNKPEKASKKVGKKKSKKETYIALMGGCLEASTRPLCAFATTK